MTGWRPRSSSMGYYWTCEYRALLDRMAEEGTLTRPEDSSGPWAALGTITHHHYQTLLKARFHPSAEAPTPEDYVAAAELFDNDLDQIPNAVDAMARQAILATPIPQDGRPWIAEGEYDDNPWVTGHIDLLSQDHHDVVDLKTTSRRPEHGLAKPENLLQMCAYRILVGAECQRAHLVYVESIRARWSLCVTIDFTTPAMVEFLVRVQQYLKYLRSPLLKNFAIPRVGDHCKRQFCPWREWCADRYRGAPGVEFAATPATQTFVDPLA